MTSGIELDRKQAASIVALLYTMNEKWDFRPSEIQNALRASNLKELKHLNVRDNP